MDNHIINLILEKQDNAIINAFLLERKANENWKKAVYEKLSGLILYDELKFNDFKDKLIIINSRQLAKRILKTLLNKGMAYGETRVAEDEAEEIANKFVELFGNDAIYYSNSTWNINRQEGSDTFEFGFKCWEFITKSTFDSGLIIADSEKIGIVWFEDED